MDSIMQVMDIWSILEAYIPFPFAVLSLYPLKAQLLPYFFLKW